MEASWLKKVTEVLPSPWRMLFRFPVRYRTGQIQDFTGQFFVEQDGSQTAAKMQKDAHAEDTDGQTELDRIFNGCRNAAGISFCLFLRNDRKQHG